MSTSLCLVLLVTWRLDVHHHLLVDVRVADDAAELLEVDAAVVVLVGEKDCLVHNLLELRVLQIVAHHHFQHLEQLPIGYVAVVVYVIYSKGKPKLGVLVPLDAELRDALDKFFEIHLPVPVLVEDLYDSLYEWVLLKLRQGHELVHGE